MRTSTCLILACILVASSCFQFSKISDYTSQGFKKVVSKFGQKFWQKNHTDLEETIFETEEPYIDEKIYKAGLDTILSLTKKSKHEKAFLECSKGNAS